MTCLTPVIRRNHERFRSHRAGCAGHRCRPRAGCRHGRGTRRGRGRRRRRGPSRRPRRRDGGEDRRVGGARGAGDHGRHRRGGLGARGRDDRRQARRLRHPRQQRRDRDLRAARRRRPRRPAPNARGQRRRHHARHQARLPRDAPRRQRRGRRLDRQHRLRRGDHRVPRHRRLLGDEVRGRPAHPRRRRRVRQARLRRARQLRLPRPGPHRDGLQAGRRHGRTRPVALARGRGRRRHRADPARSSRRGRRHGRRRGVPRLGRRPLRHRRRPARSTAAWGAEDHARSRHQARRRLRRLRLHRPPRSASTCASSTSRSWPPAATPSGCRRSIDRVPGIETVEHEVVEVEHTVAALTELFSGAKVVCNMVGPFIKYGPEVVEAALAAGCHYLDTTGEQDWVLHAQATLGRQVRRRRACCSRPGVAQMYTTGEIAANIALETPGLDTLDILVLWKGFPTYASTQTIFTILKADWYYLEQNQYVQWDPLATLRGRRPRPARDRAGRCRGAAPPSGVVQGRPAGGERQGRPAACSTARSWRAWSRPTAMVEEQIKPLPPRPAGGSARRDRRVRAGRHAAAGEPADQHLARLRVRLRSARPRARA